MSLRTLEQACMPRQSVFDRSQDDTVWNIDNLPEIDPNSFFAENYVTNGMRQLLTEVFKRLDGTSRGTSGTFLLSQSMGGGKTHNLIALALLAKYPSLRKQVMADIYDPGALGGVRVVTFSGRKSNTPFGIWGEIATQLDKREVFADLYSPLIPPGDDDWVRLLTGAPVLLLLDELPPYFEQAQSQTVGATTLDVITTTALANLFVAVSSGKLPNACVVVTDLSARAYGRGSEAVMQSLQNLSQEANRSVTRIDPVRLASDEIYHILRTRLFEALPEQAAIDSIADAYRQALDEAQKMDLTTESPDALRAQVALSYPFHPGIRDLFARFRENPGYQQTRALIKIMRNVVADMWKSGAAKRAYLVAAHDLNLIHPEISSEVRTINSTLDNAIAHDIATDTGSAVAQQIDSSFSEDAQEAATLIFLSSLSQAINPTLGLSRSEIVAYLAAPNREVGHLRGALDALQGQAWYLHTTAAGMLLFKNTENLIAKLETYARVDDVEREGEIRKRLEDLFAPLTKAVYGKVEVLPALDQVTPSPDNVTLVVFKPGPTAVSDITTFFNEQQWKNRLLFLTSDGARYSRVLERAAYLRAAGVIIAELRRENVRDDDPQLSEARNIETREQSNFYQACREAFTTLYYPSNQGLTQTPLDPKFGGNKFEGEAVIQQKLVDALKYTDDISVDGSFPNRVLNILWPQGMNEVRWNDIKRNAAQNPRWTWHHPRALDDLRDEMVRRDTWRAHADGWIERGPFAPDPTGVSVQPLLRVAENGKATLRVKGLRGDTVYWSEDGPVSTSSPRLDGTDITTDAIRVEFLCVDSTGKAETGEPYVWTNDVAVKWDKFQRDGAVWVELKAYPRGDITYSIDGSSPETGGKPYTEPFALPVGKLVNLQASAVADGVKSAPLTVTIDTKGEEQFRVEPNKSAVWKKRHKRDATGDTFDFLKAVESCQALVGGVALTVAKEQHYAHMNIDEQTALTPETIRTLIATLQDIVPGGSAQLDVSRLTFTSGHDLQDLADDLRETLKATEVEQR